ncbi:MAG: hypothetical protein LBG97_08265 [Coriobacteriales bacterium]|jgi:hypothetical protein|nr:hypothetical protein [Coriobacteriales bacterium]
MTNTDDRDKSHAANDRMAIERYSQNVLEGWVDTPYIKVLFGEYYAQASFICATEFCPLLMKFDSKIRAVYSALEMKVLSIQEQQSRSESTRNSKGAQRDLNAVSNFKASVFEAIEEKRRTIVSWKQKNLALIEEYNHRIARYIDDVLAVKTVVVDYPKLDESDLPELFAEELQLADEQREAYENRISVLERKIFPTQGVLNADQGQ